MSLNSRDSRLLTFDSNNLNYRLRTAASKLNSPLLIFSVSAIARKIAMKISNKRFYGTVIPPDFFNVSENEKNKVI